MGYYVSLVFNHNEVTDWQTAVARLQEAGAVTMPWEECNPEFLERHPERCERLVQMETELLPFILVEKKATDGHWATIRLSWAVGGEFTLIMRQILDFAEKLGCLVYDGQQKEYVTYKSLEALDSNFAGTAQSVIGILGEVKPSS